MGNKHSMGIELPYPGLRPFQDCESKIFFGRDGQVEEIIQRLERYHFAALMGGSGSGKSSIVRAGVIPKLRAYGITEQGDFWVPVTFTPGEAPISRLVKGLEKVLEPASNDDAAQQRRTKMTRLLEGTAGLQAFLSAYHGEIQVATGRENLRPHANLLIVVDQFEEIFRKGDSSSRQARYLVDLLVDAFKHRSEKIYIIITLRTEDLHRCAAYLALPEVLNQTVFLTRRLNEDELEEAIEYPPRIIARQRARHGGDAKRRPGNVSFEGELLRRLYDDLACNQADNDHLPLLQHLLYRLWEHACHVAQGDIPHVLSVNDLEAITGQRPGPSTDQAATDSPRRDAVIKKGDTVLRIAHYLQGKVDRVQAKLGGSRLHAVTDGSASDSRGRSRGARQGENVSLLARCLEAQADRVYEKLGHGQYQQDVARVMFQLLAYQDNAGNFTRRWTTRTQIRDTAVRTTELGSQTRECQERVVGEVIEAFSRPHPYIREDLEQGGNIDVSHEAFIRKWPRFRKWLRSERAAIGVYTQLDDQYREVLRACDGQPTVIRCVKRYRIGYLSRRLLTKVKKHQILERGESWVRSYENQRGSVLQKGVADRYPRVAKYIDSSRRLTRRTYSAGGLALLVLIVAVGVSVNSNNEAAAAKVAREAFKREAEVFQPLGVGARMEAPRDALGRSRNGHNMAALWEGAVALTALENNYQGFRVRVPQDPGGDKEQRRRMARAMRLSFGTVNGAVYSLLGLPVWDLGHSEEERIGSRSSLKTVAKTIMDDSKCRNQLDLGDAKELIHVSHAGNGDIPGKGVYFNPNLDAKFQFTFYSDNDMCLRVSSMGEAPGAELVAIDPKLRYYVIKTPNGDRKAADDEKFMYTVTGLRWTPSISCEKNQLCKRSWQVNRTGQTNLLAGSGDRLKPSGGERNHLLLMDEDKKVKKVLTLSPLLKTASDEEIPSGAPEPCEDIVTTLGIKKEKYNACAHGNSLIAVATWAESSKGQQGTRQSGEQVIDILSYDKTLLGDEKTSTGQEIIRLPVARLPFTGEKITHLSFPNDTGEVWLQTESKRTAKMVWGGTVLKDMACGILLQLPKSQKDSIERSPLHSPFFTAIAKNDGIIGKNNSFDCVCGQKNCS